MTRHALVCGASSGIGRAVALALAAEGHRLTLVARREDALDAVAQECRNAGAPKVHPLAADMDDRPAFFAALDAHIEAHGAPLVVVNNSGGPPAGPLLDATEDALSRGLGRHLFVAHGIAQRVVPHMTAAGWGRIVNITSISVRQPLDDLGVSNCVRHAMTAWAKTLSRELPPGITVNSVLPGFTDTERLGGLASRWAKRDDVTADDVKRGWADTTPERRLARPDEIAAAVAWLASDAASFVRGVVLPVDGGRLQAV